MPSDTDRASVSSDRLRRERQFHDERFESEAARPADAFYVVNDTAYQTYRGLVRDGAGPGTRVLEYGCGSEGEAVRLAAGGAEMVAIDLSGVALRQSAAAARDASEVVANVQMDAERLAFADDAFDFVYGSGILHHLQIDAARDEVARVLRPGGRAVFLEPLGHNPLINAYRRMTPGQRSPDEHPLLVSDLEGLRQTFGTVRPHYFVLAALAAFPLRRRSSFSTAVARLHRLDRWLFDRVPVSRRLAWTVVLDLADPRR